MRVRKSLPNLYQWREEIERIKLCGSDLRDNLFRREFWSFEKMRKMKRLRSSFVAEISNEIRANLCLKRKEGKKTNLPLSESGEEMDYLKGF